MPWSSGTGWNRQGWNRAAVSAAWSPSDLGSNLMFWFDFADAGTVTVTGLGVSSVTNKGSLGGTATQSTDALRPPYNATGLNGKGTTTYSIDRLSTASGQVVSGSTYHVAAVVKRSSGAGYAYYWGGEDTATTNGSIGLTGGIAQDWQNGDLLATSNGTNSGRNPRVVAQSPALRANTSWHREVTNLGTTPSHYEDGAALTLRVPGTGSAFPGLTTTFTIGDGAAAGGAEWLGEIAEIIVAVDQTAATFAAQVDAYFVAKWGL